MGLVARRHATLFALLWWTALSPAAAQIAACTVLDAELQGRYTGGCHEGRAEGQGEAQGSSAQYRGEFKAGRPHGKGLKTWSTGDRFEGDFVEGRKEGTGMYTWGPRSPWSGQRYTGGWLNDKRHGYGVYEWPNGERYTGLWENDRYAGAPTRSMIARSRAYAESAVVVGRVGARVCREFEVGIGLRDIVRGTVTGVDGGRISVRIEDAGKFHLMLDDRVLTKGAVINDDLTSWVPCV